MKKLCLVAVVFIFSLVFIGSEANNSSVRISSGTICPYQNQIHKDHRSNVCPYLENHQRTSSGECPFLNKSQYDSKMECPYLNQQHEKESKTAVPSIELIGT